MSQRARACSTMFSNSRTLPGYVYSSSHFIASGAKPRTDLCWCLAKRARKYSANEGISSLRSRSGGMEIMNTWI